MKGKPVGNSQGRIFARCLLAKLIVKGPLLLLMSTPAAAAETLLHCVGTEKFHFSLQEATETSEVLSLAFEGDTVTMSTYSTESVVNKGDIRWEWKAERSGRRYQSVLDTVSGKLDIYQYYLTPGNSQEFVAVVRFQCARIDERVIR